MLHSCDYPPCVRHLFVGTQRVNMADAAAKDRMKGGPYRYGRRTHCSRGHDFTASNTRIKADGSRTCRTCDKLRRTRGGTWRPSRSAGAQSRKPRKHTSRFTGVSWKTATQRWTAQIGVKYKHIHLGQFDIEIDAARAYDRAALKYFGPSAATNFRAR